MDLFGDTNTQPTCAGLGKRLINAAHGFIEFWAAYPSGPRKVAKKQCLDKWARYECAHQASHILAHVEWMKTQPEWLKDNGAFICAPLVYLNQQRWDGWTPEPVREKKPDALEIIKSHQGVAPSDETRRKIRELLGKR